MRPTARFCKGPAPLFATPSVCGGGGAAPAAASNVIPVVDSAICGGWETLIVALATLAPAIALIVTCPEAKPYTTPWITLAIVLSLELQFTNAGAFTTTS